ncbi:hypothetical protein A3L04_10500 [Thermococcus chitonophagus]|uniref:DUF7344 domain-containing protein n=1 Tax=Thermococcus chitonophagus TaxID=54262 RepID=A0A170SMP1_9EURY|nr:hypothetical protein [Thermococcus chitonophagus]ASJ17466.1 hypothetical protein A3L04_10500 [Thermococcus chitonophagus]CUX78114.1 hypothetical protein CHITON_1335 [Thermococcus chitonophagus]
MTFPILFVYAQSSRTILGNERRIWVIECLKQNHGKAEIGKIVDYIAELEGNNTRRHRKSIYVSLVQTHLPKMEREGIIKVERGNVELLKIPQEVERYMKTRDTLNFWPIIYVVFSGAALIASLIRKSNDGVIIALLLLALAVLHWIKASGQ